MQVRIASKASSPNWTLPEVLSMLDMLGQGIERKHVCIILNRTTAALGRKYREAVATLIGGDEVPAGGWTVTDEQFARLFAAYGETFARSKVQVLIEQFKASLPQG